MSEKSLNGIELLASSILKQKQLMERSLQKSMEQVKFWKREYRNLIDDLCPELDSCQSCNEIIENILVDEEIYTCGLCQILICKFCYDDEYLTCDSCNDGFCNQCFSEHTTSCTTSDTEDSSV